MSETKDEIAAERDELKAENERLKAENERLHASKVNIEFAGTAVPQHRFQLSEGDRSELAAHGKANIGGKLMTRDEVRELLGDDQAGVDLGDQA